MVARLLPSSPSGLKLRWLACDGEIEREMQMRDAEGLLRLPRSSFIGCRR